MTAMAMKRNRMMRKITIFSSIVAGTRGYVEE